MGTAVELFDLSGKVAAVTGGARGLGREMIRAFAECGADVVIASRKVEACEEYAAEITETTGRRALAVGCHVAKWDECGALVDAIYDEYGRCDVFVNNAGMSPLYPDLVSVTEELYDKTLGVNLKGPFRLGSLVGARMAEGDGGSIINVSTSGSQMIGKNELPYGCAKAGLNALTVGLAEAYAPKVRVNTLMPGPFLTDASKAWAGNFDVQLPNFLRRIGRPDEIVGAALFLASDASSFMTGGTVRVDGGTTKHV
jgi:NAD(P)-dependent dehydrogenase (short-subunit alcohol dehydrogenase family)